MDWDLESAMRGFLYTTDSFDKVRKTQSFLLNNGFERTSSFDLRDKFFAIVTGRFLYDALLIQVPHVKRMGDGLYVRGSSALTFLNIAEDGNTQYTISRNQSGIQIFLPYYLFLRAEIYDPEKRGNIIYHKVYAATSLPQGQPAVTNNLKLGYPPKKSFTDEEVRTIDPVLFDRICTKISEVRLNLDEVKAELESVARKAAIKTREKTPAGIYSKLQSRKGMLPENIDDVNGVRVLCEYPHRCYEALDAIVKTFGMPEEVIDFIVAPRMNGFQALIVKTKYKDKPLEIQVQTPYMERIAELGRASDYRQR